MKPLIGIGCALTMAVLSACATTGQPAYQAAGAPGGPGYSMAAADNGRYTIVYTGDKSMSREQVAQFALLRAAEFTIESGHEWFAVLSSTTQTLQAAPSTDLQARGGHFLGTGAQQGGDTGIADARGAVDNSSAPFGGTPVPNAVLERWKPAGVFQTVLIIQMGSGDKAAFEGLVKSPQIFSARDVSAEIRAKMASK